MNDRSPARWVPAFVCLAAIWGCSFLFIKVAVGGLHPAYVALARVAIAALVVLGVLVASGQRLPRDRRLWGHLFVVAALMNALPFSLFAFAEQRISSVLAGIWNATTPLMTLVMMLILFRGERPTRQRLVGLATGFLGVLIVLGVWRGVGGAALDGQLLCLAAATCYGIGLPYIRRFLTGRRESGLSITAGQFLLATLQLGIAAPLLARRAPGSEALRPSVIAALCALGALGTGVAFLLQYRIIRIAGPATSSTVTYLLPVFAALAGVLVLGEAVYWYEPVGGLVILFGVAISQRPRGGLLRVAVPARLRVAASARLAGARLGRRQRPADRIPAERPVSESERLVSESERPPSRAADPATRC